MWVPQHPWLCLGTVRSNILFGRGFDPDLYAAVVDACCLQPDFQQWRDGDATWVGDAGSALSVGQRFRVSLARALYARPSVLLIDDLLSALDAHVAMRVFKGAICGPLAAGSTRILVSHSTQVRRAADMVVWTYEGRPSVTVNTESVLVRGLAPEVKAAVLSTNAEAGGSRNGPAAPAHESPEGHKGEGMHGDPAGAKGKVREGGGAGTVPSDRSPEGDGPQYDRISIHPR